MKVYSTDAIRNIGMLGHTRCGKTSIAKVLNKLNKGCLICGVLENMGHFEGLCKKCEEDFFVIYEQENYYFKRL
ncbi:hypothetical protein [Neobacillus sp. CF12]|uniref:hypothetical protein n=1 Tax=Neobacillus sp. CF12 TaxID=3055864 RepID=UPI0025A1F7A2|nr:hypothetical protein [Neobacillus sp. CF12]MDM5326723.1 hypothetical protein [Neobacillus sp. CF12]